MGRCRDLPPGMSKDRGARQASLQQRRRSMGDDLAAANVNRAYSLAGTTIAIFTFTLFFMYPRFANGQVNGLLFQVTLVVLGVATFSFVFASLYYYCASAGGPIAEAERGG